MSTKPSVRPVADAGAEADGDGALGKSTLGPRLRQLRRGRGLSLADVAEGTGVSASFLSMVEKGQSDITVSRLMRLVRWFGVSIADLVHEPDPAPVHVVRSGERRSLRLVDEGIAIEMLTSEGGHQMLPVVNVYSQGGAMAEPARHEGEEFVLVVDGKIELTVGDGDPIVLGPGDSAHYRSDLPHSFRNVGRGEARFVGVTTPPNL
jgi:transcriptional regulator with XRE-family HTH domain